MLGYVHDLHVAIARVAASVGYVSPVTAVYKSAHFLFFFSFLCSRIRDSDGYIRLASYQMTEMVRIFMFYKTTRISTYDHK